jgi:transposase
LALLIVWFTASLVLPSKLLSLRIIPDNLKTGVIKPDLYDPKFNQGYDELAHHYGIIIDPARSGKPKDKGLEA